MISYSPQYLKDVLYNMLSRENPNLVKFSHSVRNRYKRLKQKQLGISRKHRAGWQVSLRRSQMHKMSVPVILSSNVRSLTGKLDELSELIRCPEYSKTGIIMLQETWLHTDIDDSLCQLNSFTMHRMDRSCNQRNRGGGLVTYIKFSWCKSSQVIFNYNTKQISCLSVQCKPRFLSRYRSIIASNIYIRPSCPTSCINEFADIFISELAPYIDNSLFLAGGDFNHTELSFLTSMGLSNIVHFSTRDNAQLDQMLVNDSEIFSVHKKAPLANSDHCIIKVSPRIYSKTNHTHHTRSSQRKVVQRRCSPENLAALKEMIAETDWDLFYDQDISVQFDQVTSYLNFCYDICCPTEVLYISPAQFSSPHLKSLRRMKEWAYKTNNRAKVRKLTALIRLEIRRLNQIYTNTLLGNQNCRQLWNTLKSLSGMKPKFQRSDHKANDLNRMFTTAASSSSALSPELPSDQSSCSINDDLLVSQHQVHSELSNLKVNKAAGPDGLPPIVLKACATYLAEPLTVMFNRCISEGKIANCWRPVRITPIPKKEAGKFRPIACTSMLLKVLEKLVLSRIFSHVSLNDEHQFAYCKKRSTLDALSLLVHTVLSTLDNTGKAFRVCFLDYSNAFNCVNRPQLLSYLQEAGLPHPLLCWIHDYFKERSQFTSYNGEISDMLPVDSGVMQGAILSPFLFSFYIRNLPSNIDNLLIKYADDVTVGSSSDENLHFSSLQSSLSSIFEWSSESSLSLNVSKCNDVLFSLAKGERFNSMERQCTSLYIGTQIIPSVNSVTYLGVTLSRDLTWSTHILNVFTKVRRLCFYVSRLRTLKVPSQLISRFVYSCIVSHLLYCSPVIFSGLRIKDYHILRRCIRIISRSSGLPRSELLDFIVKKHFSSCNNYSLKILSEVTHPLNPILSTCVSTSTSRNRYKLLYARTKSYQLSVIPYLARCLCQQESMIANLVNSLS